MRAFVQLADIWGDAEDALGIRRDFEQIVRASLPSDGGRFLIIEATADHADRARRRWAHHPCVEVMTLGDVDWRALDVEEVGVDCAGASGSALRSLDRALRGAGFWRAGRAWGQAGQSRRYRRTTDARQAMRAVSAQARTSVGAGLVHVRDRWLAPDLRRSWVLRARTKLLRVVDRADVLDDRFGRALPPVTVCDVHELLPVDGGADQPSWRVELTDPHPVDVASSCFAQHGVWPISFSYPGHPLELLEHPQQLVARIIPGFPYSFDDEGAYLQTYRSAYLGITHRKAGWDCFRHVEILAAGALPLMPDAGDIPEFSMVHYPKNAFADVVERVARTGSAPDDATRLAFRQHFERHLTSRAMAEYLLGISGFDGCGRVLFVDERLPHHADYVSVMTLIGLKQLLGSGCHVLASTDYVYQDTTVDTASLYGRGFGYTRVVSPDARSRTELGEPVDLSSFDAVIVGSITRNTDAATRILRQVSGDRMIWIHGEDTPPDASTVQAYRRSGARLFVRAIHTGRR